MTDEQSHYSNHGAVRREVKPNGHRRAFAHDYREVGTYMVTIVTEGRARVFGHIEGSAMATKRLDHAAWVYDLEAPHMVLSELGRRVLEEEVPKINSRYPQVEVWRVAMMPDHIHLLLRVKEALPEGKHLGQVVSGFKSGCSRAWWRLLDEVIPAGESAGTMAEDGNKDTAEVAGGMEKGTAEVAGGTGKRDAEGTGEARKGIAEIAGGMEKGIAEVAGGMEKGIAEVAGRMGEVGKIDEGLKKAILEVLSKQQGNRPADIRATRPTGIQGTRPANTRATGPAGIEGTGTTGIQGTRPADMQTTVPADSPAGNQKNNSAHRNRFSKKYPQHWMSYPLLFSSGYHDRIVNRPGMLENIKRYMLENPLRARIREECPRLMQRQLHLWIGGREYAAFGNLFLLKNPEKEQVFFHRYTEVDEAERQAILSSGQLTDKERQHLKTAPRKIPTHLTAFFVRERARLLRMAEEGTVLVTPGISKGESLIVNAAIDAQLPLILLQKEPITRYWKPSERRFYACTTGHLLILAPWQLDDEIGKKGEVNGYAVGSADNPISDYARFHHLNDLVQEICGAQDMKIIGYKSLLG